MRPDEAWKNFDLGDEVSVSGTFIYNGLRRFHEMRSLDNTDEIFEVLYDLSVGFERLLKIAVVLLEHEEEVDQDALEKSLITHNHLELLKRVERCTRVGLASPQKEFLGLLGTFYKSLRYDRFTLASVYDPRKEKGALRRFLGKHLKVDLEEASPILGTPNDPRYRKFIRKVVSRIATELYAVVRRRAGELNLYTYELRSGSKAERIFLGKADIPAEEVLWKELLMFFMNTKTTSGHMEFLRSIPPLDFDPELVNDYLECFQSNANYGLVLGELEHHYGGLSNPGERLEIMDLIANPNVHFDSPGVEDEEHEEDPDH